MGPSYRRSSSESHVEQSFWCSIGKRRGRNSPMSEYHHVRRGSGQVCSPVQLTSEADAKVRLAMHWTACFLNKLAASILKGKRKRRRDLFGGWCERGFLFFLILTRWSRASSVASALTDWLPVKDHVGQCPTKEKTPLDYKVRGNVYICMLLLGVLRGNKLKYVWLKCCIWTGHIIFFKLPSISSCLPTCVEGCLARSRSPRISFWCRLSWIPCTVDEDMLDISTCGPLL